MNIFFDVDYTLIDDWNSSLRPHVREVFQRLVDDGHHIYLWSGVGLRWEVVDRHGLRDLVRDCFRKPLHNHENERIRLGVPMRPDYVIDDHSEVVSAFGGFVIRPYYNGNRDDNEMLRVYEDISRFRLQNGSA